MNTKDKNKMAKAFTSLGVVHKIVGDVPEPMVCNGDCDHDMADCRARYLRHWENAYAQGVGAFTDSEGG